MKAIRYQPSKSLNRVFSYTQKEKRSKANYSRNVHSQKVEENLNHGTFPKK